MLRSLVVFSNSLPRWLWPFAGDANAPPDDVSLWEILGQIVLLAALLIGGKVAVDRACNKGCSDFREFCAAGRHVLQFGTREAEPTLGRYWPSLDVPWIVFARMPLSVATAIWYAIGVWSWLGLLGPVCRSLLAEAEPATRRQATLVAGLLVTPLAVDGLVLGGFHIFMVWCMVAGLLRASRGRDLSGGILLGLGAWMKLLPLLGVGYLVLKRRWRPAAIALACVVAVDLGLSVAAYGPRGAWREHVTWWREGAAGTQLRQLTSETAIDEDRITNQSVAVTLRRLLSRLGTIWDLHEPREHVAMANFTAAQLELAFLVVIGALGLAILAYCRRPGNVLVPQRWATEIALITLATLWLSPVTWSYHPTAALPALALVLARCRQRQFLAWLVISVWVAGLVLLAWPIARACGDLLWLTLLLGLALVAIAPTGVSETLTSEP
jgi:hypothetical protein